MNFGELRDLVSWFVNFNQGQADQDFAGPSTDANKHINRAINMAYTREVELAMQGASRETFKSRFTFTWPSGSTTMAIPDQIKGKSIISISDDTSSDPGPIIALWDNTTYGSGLYIRDSNTWGWYPAPGNAVTLTAVFIATPEILQDDGDIPALIPLQNHELIAWSAAVWLTKVSDQDIPSSWISELETQRRQYHKKLSLGSPMLSGSQTNDYRYVY